MILKKYKKPNIPYMHVYDTLKKTLCPKNNRKGFRKNKQFIFTIIQSLNQLFFWRIYTHSTETHWIVDTTQKFVFWMNKYFNNFGGIFTNFKAVSCSLYIFQTKYKKYAKCVILCLKLKRKIQESLSIDYITPYYGKSFRLFLGQRLHIHIYIILVLVLNMQPLYI